MEFNRKEIESMIEVFRKKGIKPEANTPEEFESWLDSYSSLKEEELSFHEVDRHSTDDTRNSASSYVYHRLPRISFFSGEKGKDTDFEQWKYEVECLQKQRLPDDDLFEVIRRSVKGEAATIARNLGPQTSIYSLLSKFQSMYGGVEKTEARLSQFYSARQKEDESVSSWCCRLEALFNKATEYGQDPSMISRKDEILRNMLWTGLKHSLKIISGHKFDTCPTLNDLLVALRSFEQDLPRTDTKQKGTVKMAVTATASEADWSKRMTGLESMIQQLSTDVADMRKNRDSSPRYACDGGTPAQPGYRGSDFRSHGGRGLYRQTWFEEGRVDSGSADAMHASAPRSRGGRGMYRQPGMESRQDEGIPAPRTTYSGDEVVCWRCGQPGHLQYGCRVRLDHSRRPLNSRRPMGRGRP